MAEAFATSAFQTISQLAAQPAVHQAFQWFHLQEPKLRSWHRQVVAIPAPPFGEAARAEWLTARFTALGLEEVHIDPRGNALGWLRARNAALSWAEIRRKEGPGPSAPASGPCILFSAHLDTVFPADAIGEPVQRESILLAPGACDNGAGITALLAIAAAMRAAGVLPRSDILFAGNVGEEGEGNLRGMRYLFTESAFADRIRSAVVLDGAGTETIVTHALGSKRFRVTVEGPGGHSWTDAGVPNPIVVLAHALAELDRMDIPLSPRSTWNAGHMEGGTSINAIPQRAEMRLDTRSTDPHLLRELEARITRAVEDAVNEANLRFDRSADKQNTNRNASNAPSGTLRFRIETIGERPAAKLDETAAILTTLRAVDRHLGIQSHSRIASTDANIPLSLGIEAVSIGCGGSGGRAHTREEWYDAQGRDLGLRRILLLLLAIGQDRP